MISWFLEQVHWWFSCYYFLLLQRQKYSVNLTERQKKFCLSLYHQRVNSYIFVKDVEVYKCKAKESEMAVAPLSVGSFLKDLYDKDWVVRICLWFVSCLW